MSWGSQFWLFHTWKKKTILTAAQKCLRRIFFHPDVMETVWYKNVNAHYASFMLWYFPLLVALAFFPHRFSHIKAEAFGNLWTHSYKFKQKKVAWSVLAHFLCAVSVLLFSVHIRSSSGIKKTSQADVCVCANPKATISYDVIPISTLDRTQKASYINSSFPFPLQLIPFSQAKRLKPKESNEI